MGLNDVISAERLHITFFGLRNVGKSSLVNAVTGQALSLVSPIKGTTTDPVKKAMELLPLGPVVIVDTPGVDDEGELGSMRVERALSALDYTDIAVLVVDATNDAPQASELISKFQARKIPYIVAHNKADLLPEIPPETDKDIFVSAVTGLNINALKNKLGFFVCAKTERKIVADLLNVGDMAVLVVPIDSAAPKGRLIMPQQQTIRDLLDGGMTALVCKEDGLSELLASLKKKPKIVITDSQVFGLVAKQTPSDIMLTSFSILMARYKGNLPALVMGAAQIDKLKDGDTVLIAEGCTHHRQCEDIGTVKMPKWLLDYTGKKLNFEFTSGTEFRCKNEYSLIIHCGGCTLTETEMSSRVARAQTALVPITNYGVAIALMHGILRRSLSPFPNILRLLSK